MKCVRKRAGTAVRAKFMVMLSRAGNVRALTKLECDQLRRSWSLPRPVFGIALADAKRGERVLILREQALIPMRMAR